MGEYAEMMLDGTCCSSCGEYLGEGDGYAVLCSACDDFDTYEHHLAPIEERKPFACHSCGKRFATEGGRNAHENAVHPKKTPIVPCPNCGKRVREAGLEMHQRDTGCGRRLPPLTRPAREPDDDFNLIDDKDQF